MKVNLVEICSELADIAIVEMEILTNDVAIYEKDGIIHYTEKYQDIFNKLYDDYWTLLEQQGFVHENK